MEQKWLYGIIGLLAGSLLTVFLASNAVNSNNGGMMRMMGMRQVTNQNDEQGIGIMGNIDRHFIEQMIPHHEDAITMAEIALEKAQHQEIKTLANDIKRTQSAEIDQMRVWYKDWFGADVSKTDTPKGVGMMGTRMQRGMMGDEEDIERLQNAADFDKAFIEEMIPHHQMAVMMAQMLIRSTNQDEMKKLGGDIIAAQTKEINDMRSWYKAWFK